MVGQGGFPFGGDRVTVLLCVSFLGQEAFSRATEWSMMNDFVDSFGNGL
jgi:hypothetical protein